MLIISTIFSHMQGLMANEEKKEEMKKAVILHI